METNLYNTFPVLNRSRSNKSNNGGTVGIPFDFKAGCIRFFLITLEISDIKYKVITRLGYFY